MEAIENLYIKEYFIRWLYYKVRYFDSKSHLNVKDYFL